MVKKKGNISSIKRTKAWKAAEWEYTALAAMSMLPIPDSRLSPREYLRRLEGIAEECPQFYPARLEIGLRQLTTGRGQEADSRLDEGFQGMLELASKKDLQEEFEILVDNLEKLWRYDLCRRYLQTMVKRHPRNARFRDDLAHAELRMGEIDAAILHSAQSVEMEPKNSHFRSNQGWIFLAAGKLKEAREALEDAGRLSPDNAVVRGNLEICRYLSEHGGCYFDYLVRPADRDEIKRLRTAEKWQEVEGLCDAYNDARLEAFAQTLLQEEEEKRASLSDKLSTLRHFLGFVARVGHGEAFLHEDLEYLFDRFKPIMHKCIFEFSDADCALIEDIYESLFEYYGFLSRQKLTPPETFKEFRKEVGAVKGELIEKATRYSKIRSDDTVTEEERDAILERLFEGDHIGFPV